MGLKDDLDRYREVGEDNRQDLSEFIEYGDLAGGRNIRVPVKIVSLPEFVYDQNDMGGVGQGDGDVGDPVDVDAEPDGEGDEEGDGDEAGEGEGEHGYYEMDPEEFAEEVDEEFGLDLDPKGKKVKEKTEGAMVELARSGPDSTLDFDRMFKKGLKRKMAMYFDEDYLREVLKVEGFGPQKTFEWAMDENIPVSKAWVEEEYADIPDDEKQKYGSIDDIDVEYQETPGISEMEDIPLREEDERFKHPEITKEYEKNAAIVFIRDVSGSMREKKRELVERVFTPLDWYLQGKYDNAEFVYIAHDSSAWEVDRDDFFGIQSGGGTQISSAMSLAQEILENRYPWKDWNRYVFASGDGENYRQDSTEEVVPLIEDTPANLHAYLQVNPPDSFGVGDHAKVIDEELGNKDNVTTARVETNEDVSDAFIEIMSTEDNND